MIQKYVLGTSLVLAAALLVGCSAQPGAGSSEEIVQQSGSHVAITDQPGSVEDFVGAVEDAEISRCKADGSSWVVAGSVTNPTDKTQQYRIYVSVMEKKDTVALEQVDVADVVAGATEDWETEIPIQGEGLECVLRVERFD